jgi:hypothetical protein
VHGLIYVVAFARSQFDGRPPTIDQAGDIKAYNDAERPLDPAMIDAVANFILAGEAAK